MNAEVKAKTKPALAASTINKKNLSISFAAALFLIMFIAFVREVFSNKALITSFASLSLKSDNEAVINRSQNKTWKEKRTPLTLLR